MALDDTFSDKDIIRIVENNLTEFEYDQVVKYFCEGDEGEDNKRKKEDIKNIKHEIDITVDVDVGIWGFIVGVVTGLISSEKEDRIIEQEDSREKLESFNQSVLVFIDNMDKYAPPHGRNRVQYYKRLEEIESASKILEPCKFVSDKYNDVVREYDNLKRLNDSLMDNIHNLSESLEEYFGF